MIESEWALGFNDRGMGHGDYGIIVKDTEKLVIGTIDRELAEHIINLHNKYLERQDI